MRRHIADREGNGGQLIAALVVALAVSAVAGQPAVGWEFVTASPRADTSLLPADIAVSPEGDSVLSMVVQTRPADGPDQDEHALVKVFSDGTLAWRYRRGGAWSSGGYVFLDAAGDVYSFGRTLDAGYYTFKLDGETGELLWDKPNGIGGSGMAVGDGVVATSTGSYVSTIEFGSVIALDAQSGRQLWRTDLDVAPIQMAFLPDGDIIALSHDSRQFSHATIGSKLARLSIANGDVVWSKRFYQDYFDPYLVVAEDSSIYLAGTHVPSDDYDSKAVAKFDAGTGARIWRQEIPEAYQISRYDKFVVSGGSVFVAAGVEVQGTPPYATDILELSAADGSIVARTAIPLGRGGNLVLSPSDGTLIAFSGSYGGWFAAVSPTSGLIWQRTFPVGLLYDLGVDASGRAVLARDIFTTPLDCTTCSVSAAVVHQVVAATGTDTVQTCGNGVVDPGEQCDDGNTNSFDECPSGSSHECRYNATESFSRAGKSRPTKDVKSCQMEWFVANPMNPPDRYDLTSSIHTCADGNPWCDYDATPGTCRFHLVACLNNRDPALPACEPRGISSVDLRALRFRPHLPDGSEEQAIADLSELLEDSMNHLLDPANPDLGYTNAPPLAPSEMNNCSEPISVDIPLATVGDRYLDQALTIIVRSRDASEAPKRHTAKLKLVCEPAD